MALALEDCAWLACVLCGLAIELLAFIFPDGSSKKLLPLEAATMDLSIDVCLLIFLKITLIKIHLAFVISWLPWLLVGDSAFPGIENYIQGMAFTRLQHIASYVCSLDVDNIVGQKTNSAQVNVMF